MKKNTQHENETSGGLLLLTVLSLHGRSLRPDTSSASPLNPQRSLSFFSYTPPPSSSLYSLLNSALALLIAATTLFSKSCVCSAAPFHVVT